MIQKMRTKICYQAYYHCGQLNLSVSGKYWVQNNVQLSQLKGTEDRYLFIISPSIID